jgi:hypothetical protein
MGFFYLASGNSLIVLVDGMLKRYIRVSLSICLSFSKRRERYNIVIIGKLIAGEVLWVRTHYRRGVGLLSGDGRGGGVGVDIEMGA